jgi:hypothetical protein
MIGCNCLTNTDRSENSILLGYGHCVITFRPFENKAVVLSVTVEDTWIFRHLKWRQHVTSKQWEQIIHWRDEKFRTKKVMIWYDIFYCNWFSTYIHTNNTENDTKQTIHRTTQKYIEKHKNSEVCWPCHVFAGFTLAFALQLRKKHGKTSVRVVINKYTMRIHKHNNKNT